MAENRARTARYWTAGGILPRDSRSLSPYINADYYPKGITFDYGSHYAITLGPIIHDLMRCNGHYLWSRP
jgi:hypothetical protein